MQKSIYTSSIIIISFCLFFWYLVASSFFDITTAKQREFITDGCTLLPDSSYEQCCTKHDYAYWQGGSNIERKKADKQFYDCLQKTINNKFIPTIVYIGVRIGGTPFLATPWRWGYGWTFGRGYK
jgi:hypothetical protein